MSDIYSKYPKDSGGCQCAATETLQALKNAGIEGEILKVQSVDFPQGVGPLYDNSGNLISNTNYHEVVVSNGRFYDALTGADGVGSWDEYMKLWQTDVSKTLRAVPK